MLTEIFRRGIQVLREEGLRVLIKKASSYLLMKTIDLSGLGYALAPFVVHRLRELIKDIDNTQCAVDFVFSFKCLGVSIKPVQVKYEIAELLKIACRIRPKVILEIGIGGRGTLFLFTRVAEPDAMIISIGLLGGKFGGGYPRWKILLFNTL